MEEISDTLLPDPRDRREYAYTTSRDTENILLAKTTSPIITAQAANAALHLILICVFVARDQYPTVYGSIPTNSPAGTLMTEMVNTAPEHESCAGVTVTSDYDLFRNCKRTALPEIYTGLSDQYNVHPGASISPTFYLITASLINIAYAHTFILLIEDNRGYVRLGIMGAFCVILGLTITVRGIPAASVLLPTFIFGFASYFYIIGSDRAVKLFQETSKNKNEPVALSIATWSTGQSMQYFYPKLACTSVLYLYASMSIVHPGFLIPNLNMCAITLFLSYFCFMTLDSQLLNISRHFPTQNATSFYPGYSFRAEKFGFFMIGIIVVLAYGIGLFWGTGLNQNLASNGQHITGLRDAVLGLAIMPFIGFGLSLMLGYYETLFFEKDISSHLNPPVSQRIANIRYITWFILDVVTSTLFYIFYMNALFS